MEELIEKIRARLAAGAYTNEAAVSHGIVMPLLRALGWDDADPDQVIPEHSSGRGRVDFALCGHARRSSVFIEVKGVGRSVEGDRQLFEYAFHEGVPLCLLTDGREWSFYLPSGQGTYDDRRVYRLQLDDRSSSESARVLVRYLDRQRVKSGAALDAAAADYRDSATRREAARSIPRAWNELVGEREDLLIELIADRTEALCGVRPDGVEVITFLSMLNPSAASPETPNRISPIVRPEARKVAGGVQRVPAAISTGRRVDYLLFGQARSARSANEAFVEILRALAAKSPERIPILAAAVRGSSRNHIAQTVHEIYPARPDLARAAEFSNGWLVGLNIANREKASILREACDVFGAKLGIDVEITLPNA